MLKRVGKKLCTILFLLVGSSAGVAHGEELSLDQKLIVACHRLDVDGVVDALRAGADVNARYGKGDPEIFKDPWTLGTPIATKKWTPLIAVASSSEYPDPPRKVESTMEDLDWAKEQKAKIPVEQIEARQRNMVTIARILLSHKAEIDADDGYGATALHEAVYLQKLELAKLLLRHDANVNVKLGVYIDGPAGMTPLHYADWSPELTRLLLEKGADPNAKNSSGDTPMDHVRNPAVIDVYRSFKK